LFAAGHFLFIAVAVAPTLPPASRKIKGRRNISEIDRIMLSSRREEIVARKAKANLSHKIPGKKGNSPLANLPKVNTRAECAKAAGVGERTHQSHQTRLPRIASKPPACFDFDLSMDTAKARAARESKAGSRLSLSINLNGFCFTLLHLDENS